MDLKNKMLHLANFVNDLKYIHVIKQAFATMMPVLITGAIAILLSNVIFNAQTGLAAIPMLTFLEQFNPIMIAVSSASLHLMTLGIVFFMGIELGKLNDQKGAFPGFVAFMSYVAIIPLEGGITREFTDASSLFLGMFVAITSVELYCKLCRIKRLQVKMGDAVPETVALSFSVLIPTMLTVMGMASFSFIFERIIGLPLHEIIYVVIQRPLEGVVQTLPGLLVLYFVSQLFWLIGIHGGQMIKPIRDPILLGAIAVNMDAFIAGEAAPHIITLPFWDIYMNFGGTGVTLGLMIAILLTSRQKEWRKVTKMALTPVLFNVNEIVVFGLPIVLNPLMMIPFILSPLVTGTIGYIATASGFASRTVVMIPFTTPPILSAWLATGGCLGAVITQIICIIASFAIYLPFVLMGNKEVATPLNFKREVSKVTN